MSDAFDLFAMIVLSSPIWGTPIILTLYLLGV